MAVTASVLRHAPTTVGPVLPITSAVYTGVVGHRRLRPVHHEFAYRLALPLLRLDEVDAVLGRHPFWSRRRGAPVRFRREDYLGDPRVDLSTAVRELVEAELGFRPEGPVALLAHLRTFGWCFNPLAAFYCYDATGTRVVAQVLSVSNTPWHEHTEYVIDTRATPDRWACRFPKGMHVSPFMGMDQHYLLEASAPGDRLHLALRTEEDGEVLFEASLALDRRPADRRALSHVLRRYPLMTFRVSVAIHLQAFRLWRKGVPVRRHPAKQETIR